MPDPRSALCALLVASTTSCTAVVLEDELHHPVPCGRPGDCAAGFSCQDGTCAAAEDAAGPPLPGSLVTTHGGDVAGPDGVTLHFDAGAVGGDIRPSIDTASATNVPLGFAQRSAFYEVTPAADIVGHAVITIPFLDLCGSCHVFERPENPGDDWTRLQDDDAVAGAATGVLHRVNGTYAAGEVL